MYRTLPGSNIKCLSPLFGLVTRFRVLSIENEVLIPFPELSVGKKTAIIAAFAGE